MRVLEDLYAFLIASKAKGGFERFDEYFTLSTIFFIFFMVMYCCIYFMYDKVICRRDSEFQKLDFKKKNEYVGRIISVIHAVLVVFTSYIACFTIW